MFYYESKDSVSFCSIAVLVAAILAFSFQYALSFLLPDPRLFLVSKGLIFLYYLFRHVSPLCLLSCILQTYNSDVELEFHLDLVDGCDDFDVRLFRPLVGASFWYQTG